MEKIPFCGRRLTITDGGEFAATVVDAELVDAVD
jgi:hypothetical protein